MLVVRLVQLVAFNAVKVLAHMELLVVGNLTIKFGVVEYAALFQDYPKYLVLVLVRQILTVIAYTWICLVVILVDRIRSLLFVNYSLKDRFLASNHKVYIRVAQGF